MKIDNKGFTFVEILAVIVIISLLTGISIAAFSRYKENAKSKDYEALALSSKNAMDEYMMSHPYEEGVSLEELEKSQLLSNRKDPGTKEDCTGSVKILKEEGNNSKIDSSSYEVNLCCPTYKKTYIYENGKKEPNILDLTNTEACDYTPEEVVVPPTQPIVCAAGKFLRKGHTTCELCLSKYYCIGGTFYYSSTTNQGLTPCPTGYENSAAGSKKITDCYIKVPDNKYIKTPRATTPTNCADEYNRQAHQVFYESTSSCNKNKYSFTIEKDHVGIENISLLITSPSGAVFKQEDILKNTNTTTIDNIESGSKITIEVNLSMYYKFIGWETKKEDRTTMMTNSKKYEVVINKNTNKYIYAEAYATQLYISYNANGGHLAPHKHQICPIKAECPKEKTACSWKENWTEAEFCNSKTGFVYKYKTGIWYQSDNFAKNGLADYNGGSLHMERNNYSPTGNWLVGSGDSKVKIPQNTPFDTALEFAVKCKGTYAKDFETKDISVNLYAEWKKN